MKFYKNYIVLILLLALALNWVVEGNNFMGKVNMNLDLFPKFSIIIIELLQVFVLLRITLLYTSNNFIMGAILAVAAFCAFELYVLIAMRADISIWISGIRYYFSFFPLFLITYLLAYNGHSIKREFNWLIVLILLQVPVAVYQFENISNVTIVNDRQLLFDMISGTMGGIASNLMSLVIGIGLLYFLIKFVEEKKLVYALTSLVLMVPPILAEAKGMLIIIFIVLLYLAYVFKFNFTRLLVLGLVATVIGIGFTYVYSSLGYGDNITASYLIDYANSESGGGRLSRVDSIAHSFWLLLENNTLLFGMGIGNANKSPLEHDGQFYDFFTIRHSIDILITETGLLGIAFASMLIGKLIWIANSLVRNETVRQNAEDLLVTRVFLGSIFIFIFGAFWVDALFRVQFMYPFGMMAGYVVGLYHKIDHDKKLLQVKKHKGLFA